MKNDWSLAKCKQYDEICSMLDNIRTEREFYDTMKKLNSGHYDIDLVALARERKQVFRARPLMPLPPSDGQSSSLKTDSIRRPGSPGRFSYARLPKGHLTARSCVFVSTYKLHSEREKSAPAASCGLVWPFRNARLSAIAF